MNYTLDFSDFAEADLAEAAKWYNRIRPGLTADLLLCVEEALDRICDNPQAFPAVGSGVQRAPGWPIVGVCPQDYRTGPCRL